MITSRGLIITFLSSCLLSFRPSEAYNFQDTFCGSSSLVLLLASTASVLPLSTAAFLVGSRSRTTATTRTRTNKNDYYGDNGSKICDLNNDCCTRTITPTVFSKMKSSSRSHQLRVRNTDTDTDTSIDTDIDTNTNIDTVPVLSYVESSSSSSLFATTTSSSSSPTPWSAVSLLLEERISILWTAALIGCFSGLAVVIFKKSIELVRFFCYDYADTTDLFIELYDDNIINFVISNVAFAPVFGAIVVAIFMFLYGNFAPGISGIVKEIDKESSFILSTNLAATTTDNDDADADANNTTNNYNNKSSDGNNLYTSDSTTSTSNSSIMKDFRKAIAAVATLGTGNSLGPEGPAVEVGIAVSRIINKYTSSPSSTTKNPTSAPTIANNIARNRLLLSCGAAAGVSAGFNAPLSGVFFALEIVQQSLPPFTLSSIMNSKKEIRTKTTGGAVTTDSNSGGDCDISSVEASNNQIVKESSLSCATTNPDNTIIETASAVVMSPPPTSSVTEPLSSKPINISALLLASVISALVSKSFLGSELALNITEYDIKNPLVELPLYLILGILSGFVAALYSGLVQILKNIFNGEYGPSAIQSFMKEKVPNWFKPIMGSIVCGVIGAQFPQILFFGYDTLNRILALKSVDTTEAFTLLIVKAFTTAVAVASGLVGGAFAPALFLGGMIGACYHNILEDALLMIGNRVQLSEMDVSPAHAVLSKIPLIQISEMPAYEMVGAACVLAALFRAPLTASLLLFEITQDYDVLLPLMVSAGIATLVEDVVEQSFLLSSSSSEEEE